MVSILNNIGALGASRQLQLTGVSMQRTIQRLTTGKRINQASDDAAGLGISNQLGADIRIAAQGKRNANDGISYLQVADGVLDEVTNLLTRGAELAQQAQTGTISGTNRAALDAEFQNILSTMSDIGTNTKFNGQAVFGSSVTVAVGGFSSAVISVGTIAVPAGSLTHVTGASGSITAASGSNIYGPSDYAPAGATNVNITTPGGAGLNGGTASVATAGDQVIVANSGGPFVFSFNYDYDLASSTSTVLGMTTASTNLLSAANAQSSATLLSAALTSVSNVRASIGAGQQQLNSVANSMGIQVENFTSAFSQIRDADISQEVVSLTKFQVLTQSGISALAQANQSSRSILSLIA